MTMGTYGAICWSQSWTVDLPGVGTFSSPRCADLNHDGVMDIVFGAGREEFMACDSAVVALDGLTGQMMWQVSATDQIFGSARWYSGKTPMNL